MGAVYKSICNEADDLLLLVTSLVEKEIKLKVDIEKLMNEGFLYIAKARYIMGSTCVTKMQLPTENSNPIQPLVTVSRQEVNNSQVFFINRKNESKYNEFTGEISIGYPENSECEFLGECSSKTSNNSVWKSEEAFRNILQSDPKSLKKSKNAFLVKNDLYQSYNDDLLDEMSNSSSKESLVSVTDPLRLFGILVPKALKQGQVIFNGVVNRLGDCATVQFQLREALQKYNHLIRVKNLIEVASRKTKLDFLKPKVYWTPTESSSVSCYSIESEEEEEEEKEREKEERGGEGDSKVSLKKSIRSVLYSLEYPESQEQEELQVWGSADNVNESDN